MRWRAVGCRNLCLSDRFARRRGRRWHADAIVIDETIAILVDSIADFGRGRARGTHIACWARRQYTYRQSPLSTRPSQLSSTSLHTLAPSAGGSTGQIRVQGAGSYTPPSPVTHEPPAVSQPSPGPARMPQPSTTLRPTSTRGNRGHGIRCAAVNVRRREGKRIIDVYIARRPRGGVIFDLCRMERTVLMAATHAGCRRMRHTKVLECRNSVVG